MKTYIARYFFLGCCVALALTACGPRGYVYHGGGKITRKKLEVDQQTYQPYRDQNTLEAYQDFLHKHPTNSFWKVARDKIDILEFKPYEKLNTVEGYLEFKMLYPRNPNVKKANWHIEQVEIRRYDNLDTIAGYREFIEKYPDSIFVNSAHERLQELTFRNQDRQLRKQYGFDLLKYRYEIRKAGASHDPLWNFQVFAHVRKQNGKASFVSRLLYSTLPALQEESVREQLKTKVVGKLLNIIASQGTRALKLPQPSFEIYHAPEGLNANARLMLSYTLKPGGLRLLAAGKTQPSELLTASQAMPAPAAASSASAKLTTRHIDITPNLSSIYAPVTSQAAVKATKPPAGPMEIMQRVATDNSATDAVLSRRWETKFQDGRTHALSSIEKHRWFKPQNKVRSAMVLRYLNTSHERDATFDYDTAILHQRSKKGKDRYWFVRGRGDASRAAKIEPHRPDAENKFFLEHYVDIAPESETHKLVAITTYRNRPAALIKSTPLRTNPYYAWRRSTIDRERMVPLMIEYYNAQGTLQKNVTFSWKQRFGIWYWDMARFQNLENGSITRITTTDIRINLDLPKRDFLPGALSSRLIGR
jgi:hypothetical protein